MIPGKYFSVRDRFDCRQARSCVTHFGALSLCPSGGFRKVFYIDNGTLSPSGSVNTKFFGEVSLKSFLYQKIICSKNRWDIDGLILCYEPSVSYCYKDPPDNNDIEEEQQLDHWDRWRSEN